MERTLVIIKPDAIQRSLVGDIISRFEKVLVPEMNMGQLLRVLRAEYLVDAVGLNKIQGRPFKVSEISARIARMLEE